MDTYSDNLDYENESMFNESSFASFYNASSALSVSKYNPSMNLVQKCNETANHTCLLYDFTIEAVVMGLLCLFGFAGNTLSIVCLWRDKSTYATPFLLISLEIADTLFLVTVLLLRVMTSIHQFTGWFASLSVLFPYLGTFVFPCALIASMCTNYLTILVTVNRYIFVCRPYETSKLCSIQQARKQVAMVWIVCIIYNIPRFFESEVDTRYHPLCKYNVTRSFPTALAMNPVYGYVYGSVMYSIFIFLIPLVSLILLNYKLICALRETQKRRAKLLTHDSHNHSEDDITLTLIVVVLVFVVTQTPALVTQLILSALSRQMSLCPSPFFYYFRLSDLMVVANSASNFIIYIFCNRRFQHILMTLVCEQKHNSPEMSAVHNAAHAVTHYRPVAIKDEHDTTDHRGEIDVTAV